MSECMPTYNQQSTRVWQKVKKYNFLELCHVIYVIFPKLSYNIRTSICCHGGVN